MGIAPTLSALRTITFAAAILCPAAAGAQTQSVQTSVPSAGNLVRMVRMTMIAVQHANFTGNYTVLRDLGTPGFASKNTAASLAHIFRSWRRPDRNLGAVSALEPIWLVTPVIDKRGLLSLKGYFPTTPVHVRFVMMFKPVRDHWRLEAISLATFKPRKPTRARR